MVASAPKKLSLLGRGWPWKRRQYAAAKGGRLTNGHQALDPGINELIRSSAKIVRGRVRKLARDFPFVARAVAVLINLTVGTGIKYQSRVRKVGSLELDPALIQQIEDSWERWMEQADVSGKLHFYEMMRLAKRGELEAGEFLFVKRHSANPKRYLPFTLQAIEVDRLADFGADPAPGNDFSQGIEYDKSTGEVVAYWLQDDLWKVKRIPADAVIHDFELLRPGQIRGISPLAPAVILANDLDSYLNAEIDGAKMAAKWLGFVQSPDLAEFQAIRMQTDPRTGQKIERLENAIIEYLQPGEKIELATSNRPGDSFEPFVRLILRMIAVTTGVSYELLSGDYQGINYSNLRGIRNDLLQQMKPHQDRMIRHFCAPVFREFLEQAYLAGRLRLPGYERDPAPYLRGAWIPPGMESADPYREGKAASEQIQALLRSPQEVISARGRDPEEVLDEIAEYKRQAEERGLSMAEATGGLKTNPAALGASEEEDMA